MRTVIVVLMASLLAACAADPAKIDSVAGTEADRLAATTRPLSSFAAFELAPMVYDDKITAEDGKREEANEFEALYASEVGQLLDEWRAGIGEGADGTLVIESHLTGLRVVSGGARFWAGAFMGDSFIDLDLTLVEKDSAEQISKVRVYRDADSMAGAWSYGKSDQNLDQYIVAIIQQYLENNY